MSRSAFANRVGLNQKVERVPRLVHTQPPLPLIGEGESSFESSGIVLRRVNAASRLGVLLVEIVVVRLFF